MDDKNRPGPKKGTTGTEGGVSEKDKDRALREKQTGEKVENKPPTPKEAPPLPHADQERIQAANEGKYGDKTSTEVSGLEVSTPTYPLPPALAFTDHSIEAGRPA
jgi:hypothetical protein